LSDRDEDDDNDHDIVIIVVSLFFFFNAYQSYLWLSLMVILVMRMTVAVITSINDCPSKAEVKSQLKLVVNITPSQFNHHNSSSQDLTLEKIETKLIISYCYGA
jgi:tRNA(Glu) U13 pseudouridine synthase TruD